MFDHKGNPIGDHHQTLRTAALNTVPKPHTPKPKPHTGRKTFKTEDETRQFHHHSPYDAT